MKTLIAFLSCTGLMAALGSGAQSYSIDWLSIDGGGGSSSTGGAYSLSGTIGQPDAGLLAGGAYSLTGGFWAVISTTGAGNTPALRIFRSGSEVILAWPFPSLGFQLQESATLSSPNWVDIGGRPGLVGSENQVSQPLDSGLRFYRLRQP